MIVYLRGDEDYFDEFDLDADQAMVALGIKRSRLTQISGKELRVGRVRKDRYIRPVYRQADIEAYLSWSRPTATHKAAADSMVEATDHIHQRIELLEQALSQKLQTAHHAQHRDIALGLQELHSLSHHHHRDCLRQLQTVKATIADHRQNSSQKQLNQQATLQELQERLTTCEALIQTLLSSQTAQEHSTQSQIDQLRQAITTQTHQISQELSHLCSKINSTIRAAMIKPQPSKAKRLRQIRYR